MRRRGSISYPWGPSGCTPRRTLEYDYLVIATGPDLAHDEVEGLGQEGGFTQSICRTSHAMKAAEACDAFVKDPGPIVVGAVQGVSCFGPAYEFAMILDTDSRRRKIRDKVPMTFVTPERYVGHLGLGGVWDTKGLLESLLQDHNIRWICNAKTMRIENGRVFVTELDEDAKEKKKHELPFKYSMMMPAFRGVPAVAGIEGLVNPRGFVTVDKHQRTRNMRTSSSSVFVLPSLRSRRSPYPPGFPRQGT